MHGGARPSSKHSKAHTRNRWTTLLLIAFITIVALGWTTRTPVDHTKSLPGSSQGTAEAASSSSAGSRAADQDDVSHRPRHHDRSMYPTVQDTDQVQDLVTVPTPVVRRAAAHTPRRLEGHTVLQRLSAIQREQTELLQDRYGAAADVLVVQLKATSPGSAEEADTIKRLRALAELRHNEEQEKTKSHQLQQMILIDLLRKRDIAADASGAHDTAQSQNAIAAVQGTGGLRGAASVSGKSLMPPKPPHICVVIRTCRDHGTGSLRQLLDSLRASPHQAWEALLIVKDRHNWPELPDLISSMRDKRIRIHTLKTGLEQSAEKADGSHNFKFHQQLYEETDRAIRTCSPHTQWFTATNGDNAYTPEFWDTVASLTPHEADVLAFDFYSRFYRLTEPACHRFAVDPGQPSCKANLLRLGHTDLASLVYSWPKWIMNHLGFSSLPDLPQHYKNYGLHDAAMAHHMIADGWKVRWVGADVRCLISHSPNPQLCVMKGGVWDDRNKNQGGGRCLTAQEAGTALSGGSAELVSLPLTHDPEAFKSRNDASNGFFGVLSNRQTYDLPHWPVADDPTTMGLRGSSSGGSGSISESRQVKFQCIRDPKNDKEVMDPSQFHTIATLDDERPEDVAAAREDLLHLLKVTQHDLMMLGY